MDQIARLLSEHGLALVFVNVFLTQIGVPVPAVPVLLVAGAYLHLGELALVPLVVTAVFASLLGDLPWFVAGRRHGYRVLGFLCRVAVEPGVCVQRTEERLARWGAPSLMIAKFVPGFATVAPPLAGATRLPLATFLGYSAVGAGLWAGAAILAGVLFRHQIELAVAWIEAMGIRAATIILAVVGVYIVFKYGQRVWFMRRLRMARVTAAELRTMMSTATPPVILDARSAAARAADPRHIPGAVPVDIDKPETALIAVPPDHDVVVYCS